MSTLASCQPIVYYQLVNTKPVGNLTKTDNAVVYEDSNCRICYDLWSNGGTTCVRFENKTDEDIYLDLSGTFYFMNGQAFDLYTGTTVTKSISVSNGGWSSAGNHQINQSTVVSQSRQIETIPARMYKIIEATDVTVMSALYRDCNLWLVPSKKNISSSTFSQSDSPFTFGLRFTYYVGQSSEPIRVKNEFYVEKMTNYPQSLFQEYINDKDYGCSDEKLPSKKVTNYFFAAPDAFYFKYDPTPLATGPMGRKH